MKRRHFCKAGITTALGLGMPGFVAACKHYQADLPASTGINSRVAAISGVDLGEMTRDALQAIGGIERIVHEGETVFIKPNFVNIPWARSSNCFLSGECTKPEIIVAVAEESLKAGARRVIIGEGSHLPVFEWKYATTLDGKTNLVAEASRLNKSYEGHVSLACLETDSPSWSTVPSTSRHNQIAVSSLVTDADRIITLPVAKTHSWAQLTLGTKNFLGITPLSEYAQLVDNTWWNRGSFDHSSPEAIARIYLDIVKGIRPDLSIIDFSIGLEGNGPTLSWGGETVDMKARTGSWALLASTDIMAADAMAALVMDHNIEQISQLSMGFEMGLGEIREGSIEIVGEDIQNLRSSWKHARLMG